MGAITASLVKELRDKTGAGMMDCKKALTETDGDLEGAVDWLRKKGLAAAAKKAGRAASEGLVGVAADGNRAAMVEVNAETDFVARNEDFQGFVKTATEIALAGADDIDALNAAEYPGTGRTVAEELNHKIATIGENMSLRRVTTLGVDEGVVATYMHGALSAGLGKIGVLVGLQSGGDAAALQGFGKQLAMHVAASDPQAVSRDDVDASLLERERAILSDQARASGKPENIIEKMVEGRLRKYYEEICLLEQTFAIDGETKVSAAVDNAAGDAGAPVTVAGFARYKLGEGVEKKEDDFAAEVAAAAGV